MNDDNSYQKAVVSFIDVLGFKGIVEDKKPEEILTLLKLFRDSLNTQGLPPHQTGNESPKANKSDLRAIYFSDSIVRLKYLKDYEYDDVLLGGYVVAREILELARIQRQLLSCGILIRGGVSLGDVFFDVNSGVIFGPALVEAYEIESSFAIDPRIAVSEDIYTYYNKCMQSHPRLIRRDSHNTPWIDFFIELHSETDLVKVIESRIDLILSLSKYCEYSSSQSNIVNVAVEASCSDLGKTRKGQILDVRIASKYEWCIYQAIRSCHDIYEYIENSEFLARLKKQYQDFLFECHIEYRARD
jgi:hypothetical protein